MKMTNDLNGLEPYSVLRHNYNYYLTTDVTKYHTENEGTCDLAHGATILQSREFVLYTLTIL